MAELHDLNPRIDAAGRRRLMLASAAVALAVVMIGRSAGSARVVAHFDVGIAENQNVQADDAIAAARKAIALDPSNAGAHRDLGAALRARGQIAEAIACFRKAIELDPRHAGAYSDLGTTLHAAGRLDDAIACYRKAIELDPRNAAAFIRLGNALQHRGQSEEAIACFRAAEPIIEDTLKQQKSMLGTEHPATLATMGNLARVYKLIGKLDRAVPLYEETLRLQQEKLGTEHPDTLATMNGLAEAYVKAGKSEQAGKLMEKSLRQSLARGEQTAPDAWTTFNTQSLLGEALLRQKKYVEAEPLLVKGYDGMKAREKAIPEQARNRLPETLDRLIELFTATNRPDEAQKWQAERAMYPRRTPPP
jgi:tetratricopeptide (TPR) repeat protein